IHSSAVERSVGSLYGNPPVEALGRPRETRPRSYRAIQTLPQGCASCTLLPIADDGQDHDDGQDQGSLSLLELPAARRHQQLHELFGHFRFESFRMSFVEALDVRDHATVLAPLIDEGFRVTRSRQQAPAFAAWILPSAVIHIAGLSIDDFAERGLC